MNIEELRELCISVKGALESFPFAKFGRGAENILVFKVMGKLFAYIDIFPKDGVFKVLIKCNHKQAEELRAKYVGITASSRDPERNWNVIELDSDVPDTLIKQLIQQSVVEVINGLSKKKQKEYWENS